MCLIPANNRIKTNDNAYLQCFDGPPETAVPVLKLYYQRTRIQPAAGDGGSSTKVVLPENEDPAGPPETAVPVLQLYYQRTKIQPARRRRRFQYQSCTTRERRSSRPAGDGGSSTKVVLPENENPAGSPETAIPVLKLYCKERKSSRLAGDGVSSTEVVFCE